MRLVVLSFSHHGQSLGRVGRELGHEIVGVMDGDESPRRQLEREFQCPGFDTARACLDASKPEAAFLWLTRADQRYPRGPRARRTSFLSSMTPSIVATVEVATGRPRRSAVQMVPSSAPPLSQRACRISSSRWVGSLLGGRAI